MSPILVIAEAGVNHNGSLSEAKRLVDAAKHAGADIVKFQTFKAENLVTKSAAKAGYQIRETGSKDSQLEMLKNLELSFDDFLELAEYCDRRQIEFLSTAFDEDCLDFLVRKAGIKRIKIPSGELTNGPLISLAASTALPIILSTGMATVAEIKLALDVIVTSQVKGVSLKAYEGAFQNSSSTLAPVTILHCTTEYPAPLESLNLSAMQFLKSYFGLSVGYSDHSQGILASVLAAGLGATVIEKHFTLSKDLPGPDHKASLEPYELLEMVRQIRVVEEMMGSGFKEPSKSELENAKVARKSIVARRRISEGEPFTKENLTCKRPGTGLSPMKFWNLLGQRSHRTYEPDDMILEEDLPI